MVQGVRHTCTQACTRRLFTAHSMGLGPPAPLERTTPEHECIVLLLLLMLLLMQMLAVTWLSGCSPQASPVVALEAWRRRATQHRKQLGGLLLSKHPQARMQ